MAEDVYRARAARMGELVKELVVAAASPPPKETGDEILLVVNCTMRTEAESWEVGILRFEDGTAKFSEKVKAV